MSDSLREQLLKAGLVSRQQAAQAERQQHRQRHQPKPGGKRPATAEPPRPADAAQAAKAARDRELNKEREARARARAVAAEIKQLIDQHALPRPEGDDYYNFVAGRKIRRVAVNADLLERLGRGDIAIVRHEGRSALVPAEIAARIRERDERAVITFKAEPEPVAEDDPYKDFVVPDDLRW
ncbi:MAG: DUF2058 domain-containing protein [Steroidobacteraceae bacterium]|jgi:hypothetical protein|nr:DUF2058 domain-containing protein [Steroidobacteraceae bacterium]